MRSFFALKQGLHLLGLTQGFLRKALIQGVTLRQHTMYSGESKYPLKATA